MIEKIKHIFIKETKGDLISIRKEIEAFYLVSNSQVLVEKVFRTMHTIKGTAPMFGFSNLSEIAQPVAKAYEHFYNGKGNLNTQIIEKTTDVIDLLHNCLNREEAHLPINKEEKMLIVDFFNGICEFNEGTDDR